MTPPTIPALLRELAAEFERLGFGAPAPQPPPPVPPPPAPQPPVQPPAPPAPAPSPAGVTQQPLNMGAVVVAGQWIGGGRYERFRHLEVFAPEVVGIPLKGFSFAAGGATVPLRAAEYALLLDGVQVAVTTPTAPFRVDLRNTPEGWHRLDVTGLAPGETAPSWWIYVLRGARASERPTMPVVRGTYEVSNSPPDAAFALVPGRFAPTPRPLVKRTAAPFATPINRSGMHCTQLVPVRSGDLHRPCISAKGIVTTFDKQAYFWDQMVARLPSVALLDGPRGVGTVAMLTHAEVGQGTGDDGQPMGTIYFCDPWRMGKVSATGHVTTLVGYRHKGMPGQWQSASTFEGANLELVGDWSAVPADRRGMHELWGMAWDERTLAVDEQAAPIPSEGNRRPHLVGPVCFLADTQNNRVLRVEFSATSHATPAKVAEFITGLGDPWDVVCEAGVLYVSERASHRIAAYDATTGALLRVVCSGERLASVDANRFVRRLASDPVIQAQPCVAPEGLFKLPGDPWLYFGSFAMKQVKRVNLQTGAVEMACAVPVDGNSQFLKIAVSDGTFGPRGTIFVWSWSNAQFGHPFTWLPEGGPLFERWSGWSRHWSWYEQDGGAGLWSQFAYGTAGGVRNGMLVCGGAGEGLQLITARQAGDIAASAAATRGAREYRQRGLNLLHGHGGFGYYGLPLPWGVSEDIDAHLTQCGHTRAA